MRSAARPRMDSAIMTPLMELGGFWVILVFMLVGLFGLVIPVFPGLLVMWLAALAYGLTVGFNWLSILIFVLITALAVFGMLIDNILMGAGARRGGAAGSSVLAGTAAGFVFTFVFPPIGGLIAAPLTVLLLEFWRKRNMRDALKATGGLAAGWGLSFVARFLIGLGILGLWLVWAFVH